MNSIPRQPSAASGFRPWRVILAAVLGTVTINLAIHWYAREVAMPRYCANTGESVGNLRHIVTRRDPFPDEDRRGHLVAAKLLFLEPRRADEPIEDYLKRIRTRIDRLCE